MDKALRYVLEVYRQVRQSGASRIHAAKTVARQHRISQQTVMSACTRDAGISSTAEFDRLLQVENISELRSHLVKRYPSNKEDVHRFFMALGREREGTAQPISKIDTLFDDERKNLLNKIIVDLFKNKFTEWQMRSDIPPDVRTQIGEWLGIMRG
jgi:hypothetical protein